jgi:hypothetical protein
MLLKQYILGRQIKYINKRNAIGRLIVYVHDGGGVQISIKLAIFSDPYVRRIVHTHTHTHDTYYIL